jgi:hypothetical protein
MGIGESDPEARPRVEALEQGFRELGWVKGKNLQLDYRWTAGDLNRAQRFAVPPWYVVRTTTSQACFLFFRTKAQKARCFAWSVATIPVVVWLAAWAILKGSEAMALDGTTVDEVVAYAFQMQVSIQNKPDNRPCDDEARGSPPKKQ